MDESYGTRSYRSPTTDKPGQFQRVRTPLTSTDSPTKSYKFKKIQQLEKEVEEKRNAMEIAQANRDKWEKERKEAAWDGR